MVRSLVVVLAVVAVVVLIAQPRMQRIERPVPLDEVTAQAQAAGLPVTEPQLPEGWKATGARYAPDTAEGLPTWHVGYLTPEGRYAGVDVTRGATPRWIAGASASGREVGTRTVDGETWRLLSNGEPAERRSLVLEQDGATVLVSGTAPLEQLDLLAEAATP
jgi:hypothetical protein